MKLRSAFVIILFSCVTVFIHQVKAGQKVFNIATLGAVGNGKTDNTHVIQKAIDNCTASGGGIVLVPQGKFVTGVIDLKSNVELRLAPNAQLLATVKRIAYGPGKASPLIVASGCKNIAITGTGIINGRGEALLKDIYRMLRNGKLKDKEWKTYNEWHQLRPEEDNRPKLIFFKQCDNVKISDVTIKNGLCWIQEYRACTNMLINNIKVISNTFLNNDGIDLVDCKKVKLTNSFFNVADDGICLKSSDPKSFCEDIVITDCRIRSSASAFKMGTASFGGFKKITVRNIEVYDTFRSAVAIESVDGGVIEDIDIRHVVAKNTGNAIFIRLGKRQKLRAAGSVSGIYIADVKAGIPAGKPDAGYHMEGPPEQFAHNVFPMSVAGIPGSPVSNVTLEGIDISYAAVAKKKVAWFNIDSLSKVPEQISAYPEFSMFGELPVSAFYARHAEGINLKNIHVNYTGYDFRTPFVFDDVNGLIAEKINVSGFKTLPLLLLNNVKVNKLLDIQPADKRDHVIKTQ
ncbi:glycoside hydrolase family 28 protein [Mucilaginibacter sp. SG564]|uniref:glycoside hydrolase family 28 protein n=1 Tax=unclassified Mucilaginibacter TaxID=2617802 RepID=UPI001553CA09|nr:glycosyl hydrolase family 28 protein [Mucilaginibacter sp. SG564]NOW97918.1 polygalacturonase [Mucilaginibacter sp. SG564]